MRTSTVLLFAAVVPLGFGCTSLSYNPLDGVSKVEQRGDHAQEIEALAKELADRAESRSPLGNARIQLGAIDAIEPRRSPYRQVSILERDLRATEATVRHELSMSLGNRVNIVGEGAEIATHRIEGEFLRSSSALEVSLRLVEIKSDWIVATARRRIDQFIPEYYDRRLQPEGTPVSLAEAASPSSSSSPSGAGARALRPAYPVPGRDTGSVLELDAVPEPTTVLSARQTPQGASQLPSADAAEEIGAPIEFESGPAAARLRATGVLPKSSQAKRQN